MSLRVFTAWLTAKLGVDDERGANLVEYVLLITLIALIVVIAVTAIGTKVSTKYDNAGVPIS